MASSSNDLAIKALCESKKYEITTDGKVFELTIFRNPDQIFRRELKQHIISKYGYKTIGVLGKNLLIHRVIAQKFIGNIDGLQVNHKDGNPANNHIDNLELVTAKENMAHSVKFLNGKNRGNKGTAINSKINQQIADEIRHLFLTGSKASELATTYKFSRNSVYKIVNNKSWTKAAANG